MPPSQRGHIKHDRPPWRWPPVQQDTQTGLLIARQPPERGETFHEPTR
jgi:hypothetical protein